LDGITENREEKCVVLYIYTHTHTTVAVIMG